MVQRHLPQRYLPVVFLIPLMSAAASAEPPTPEEMGTRLRSVCVKGTTVFGVTQGGLYRGDRESREWERLTLPDQMPPGGSFAPVPGDSEFLIYRVGQHDLYDVRQRDVHRTGIYLSRDRGESWELVSDGDYGPVLLHQDGSLYAVTNPHNIEGPSRVRRSRDLGESWQDITGDSFGMILDIFPDPDHPELVCLRVNAIRMYILQAEDDTYQWKPIVEWEWHPEVRQTSGFFERTYWTQTTAYGLAASMEIFFDYGFDDDVRLCAFEITPSRSRIEIQSGDPVEIPFRLDFRENLPVRTNSWNRRRAAGETGDPEPTPYVVRMIDDPASSDAWGVRVERDDDRQTGRSAASRSVYDSQERDRAKRAARAAERWHVFDLSADSPYERSVVLDELHDFSQPGTYRVQLFYDNGWVADRSRGEWIGFFTSPVFEVVVTE